MRLALLGNPNTGKTSLFNMLTDTYAAVGNWSGVTVEKKSGRIKTLDAELVDLPGIYSFKALSEDEQVAVRFLFEEPVDVLLNIVDASQLRRNLQLTLMLLEMDTPLIVALNMIDVAKAQGLRIDTGKLSRLLGVPVVPVVARRGMGKQELLKMIRDVEHHPQKTTVPEINQPAAFRRPKIDYGERIERAVAQIEARLASIPHRRFMAFRYLEGHPYVTEQIDKIDPSLRALKETLEREIEKQGMTIGEYLTAKRYAWMDQHIFGDQASDSAYHAYAHADRQKMQKSPVSVSPLVGKRHTSRLHFSERLDALVTHPVLGIPIFLGLMYIIFQWTFDWLGTPLSDALEAFFSGPVTDGATWLLDTIGAAPFYRALIVEGIIAGVGGVLVFVPQIFILFFFISLLEDSGYMARVAVVMDRLMDRFGLSGKAFIPLIIGFGCNVPGVMAARTIDSPRERLLTMLVVPYMSCSARLAVYALFVGTFFKHGQGFIILSLYVLGVVMALATAKWLSLSTFHRLPSLFLVELPPYRLPHGRTLFRSTWEKGKGFVKKAGTFILAGSVVIWLLGYVGPQGIDVPIDESFLAQLGNLFAPLFTPLGFPFWQAVVALITGFLAKEVVISTLNIVFYAGSAQMLTQALYAHFTPLSAYAFLVFMALYIPCLATVAALLKESGSRKWMVFSMSYSFVLAYVTSLIIYQVGRLLGLG
ncbi:MAG: ferrous iron transport protein B [Candidatus Carbobacillus altaicus]|nr:ferrous iron transport protein B [Candidatus Carbobacillus altaicus]